MLSIPLTQGKETVVDDDCPRLVLDRCWCAVRLGSKKGAKKGYFYAICHNTDGPRLLHRMIMGSPEGKDIDHINGDTLDNRRCNLRVASRSQNRQNAVKRTSASSSYKGVYKKYPTKWVARVTKDYKTIHLGYFSDEIDAAIAYDLAAIEEHGEFARTNFLEPRPLAHA